jgi:hypothetical protein
MYRSGIQILEEAARLVRTAPPSSLFAYYAGTLPFALGVLYFWAAMSQAPFAARLCGPFALVLAFLFLWMKAWQAVYMRGLRAHLAGDVTPWSRRRLLRVALTQAAVQPAGLVALPLALLATLPFAWVYAFYQNLSALDDGESPQLARRAWEEAKRWPAQNHALVWLVSPALLLAVGVAYLALLPVAELVVPEWGVVGLRVYAGILLVVLLPLSPLGVVLCVNLAGLTAMVPMLARSLLGLETFMMTSGFVFESSTYYAAIVCTAFLLLDPLAKACYVLRCFYGESLHTGRDLLVELRQQDRIRRAVPVLVLLAAGAAAMAAAGHAHADEGAAVEPQRLGQTIDQVLAQQEYVWRLPRDYPLADDPAADTWLGALLRGMEDAMQWVASRAEDVVRHLKEWWRGLWDDGPRPQQPERDGETSWRGAVSRLTYVLVGLLLLALAVLVLRVWWRSRHEVTKAVAVEAPPPVDLEDEGVHPDDLPEDGWLRMAEDLATKGDHRLAARATFLAMLAWLSGRGLIVPARYKSNRDYLREVHRRSHEESAVLETFARGILPFEQVWYGTRQADAALVAELRGVYDQLIRPGRSSAPQPGPGYAGDGA